MSGKGYAVADSLKWFILGAVQAGLASALTGAFVVLYLAGVLR